MALLLFWLFAGCVAVLVEGMPNGADYFLQEENPIYYKPADYNGYIHIYPGEHRKIAENIIFYRSAQPEIQAQKEQTEIDSFNANKLARTYLPMLFKKPYLGLLKDYDTDDDLYDLADVLKPAKSKKLLDLLKSKLYLSLSKKKHHLLKDLKDDDLYEDPLDKLDIGSHKTDKQLYNLLAGFKQNVENYLTNPTAYNNAVPEITYGPGLPSAHKGSTGLQHIASEITPAHSIDYNLPFPNYDTAASHVLGLGSSHPHAINSGFGFNPGHPAAFKPAYQNPNLPDYYLPYSSSHSGQAAFNSHGHLSADSASGYQPDYNGNKYPSLSYTSVY